MNQFFITRLKLNYTIPFALNFYMIIIYKSYNFLGSSRLQKKKKKKKKKKQKKKKRKKPFIACHMVTISTIQKP